MIHVEPDEGGSPVESQVRCERHGVIARRFAVLPTAVDSALRHHRAHHATSAVGITIDAGSAAMFYPRIRR